MLIFAENSLIYPGSPYPRGDWEPSIRFEDVNFESADGTQLHGWFLEQPDARENVLICHGNAENVAQSTEHMGHQFRKTLNANVFVFDYRGYGKSEGSPNESGVSADTQSALDWFCNRLDVASDKVIVVGHSIGGGPAVDVAVNNPVKALVLQRTFASLVEPAQNRYWFVPVSLFMQNRFESAKKIKNCSSPLFQSHGTLDQLIPIESGKKVFNNSPATTKRFYAIPEANHWTPLPNEYWSRLTDFVAEINR